MTTSLRAHFDGKVLVPEGPVDLPVGQTLDLNIAKAPERKRGLARLAEFARTLPGDPASPGDAAAQHDHHLYGLPKRP